jgi:hypothetical protein
MSRAVSPLGASALLAAVVLFPACGLNPQPIPPGEQPDSSVNEAPPGGSGGSTPPVDTSADGSAASTPSSDASGFQGDAPFSADGNGGGATPDASVDGAGDTGADGSPLDSGDAD